MSRVLHAPLQVKIQGPRHLRRKLRTEVVIRVPQCLREFDGQLDSQGALCVQTSTTNEAAHMYGSGTSLCRHSEHGWARAHVDHLVPDAFLKQTPPRRNAPASQLSVLQFCDACMLLHSAPDPWRGTRTSRVRLCMPLPQVLEHGAHAPHAPGTQSMEPVERTSYVNENDVPGSGSSPVVNTTPTEPSWGVETSTLHVVHAEPHSAAATPPGLVSSADVNTVSASEPQAPPAPPGWVAIEATVITTDSSAA